MNALAAFIPELLIGVGVCWVLLAWVCSRSVRDPFNIDFEDTRDEQ